MHAVLTLLSFVALRNLFFKETIVFLAAIDTETADELKGSSLSIRLLDQAIEAKRTLKRIR